MRKFLPIRAQPACPQDIITACFAGRKRLAAPHAVGAGNRAASLESAAISLLLLSDLGGSSWVHAALHWEPLSVVFLCILPCFVKKEEEKTPPGASAHRLASLLPVLSTPQKLVPHICVCDATDQHDACAAHRFCLAVCSLLSCASLSLSSDPGSLSLLSLTSPPALLIDGWVIFEKCILVLIFLQL